MRANAEGAWSYLLDRRIKDPIKFHAVQTYRASVHLLTQQLVFVQSMRHGEQGMRLRLRDEKLKSSMMQSQAGVAFHNMLRAFCGHT